MGREGWKVPIIGAPGGCAGVVPLVPLPLLLRGVLFCSPYPASSRLSSSEEESGLSGGTEVPGSVVTVLIVLVVVMIV